jgi:GNAT superfamily N-acetyltransferase
MAATRLLIWGVSGSNSPVEMAAVTAGRIVGHQAQNSITGSGFLPREKIMPRSLGGPGIVGVVRVELYDGDRVALRWSFELAEDSAELLDGYLYQGRVLVARDGGQTVGHLQLVDLEIKNMAVVPQRRGTGVGAALIDAAAALVRAEGGGTVLVATGAADVGNLRFYQRQGFRFRSVRRDFFTPVNGYPAGIMVDGIELRDQVWLDREIQPDR